VQKNVSQRESGDSGRSGGGGRGRRRRSGPSNR
jgi:hypothetical protein